MSICIDDGTDSCTNNLPLCPNRCAYRDDSSHDQNIMKINCIIKINGQQVNRKWGLRHSEQSYDNLESRVRLVAVRNGNYWYDQHFVFFVHDKYTVANQQDFIKYCIDMHCDDLDQPIKMMVVIDNPIPG